MPTPSVNYEQALAVARRTFGAIDPFIAAANTDAFYEPDNPGTGRFILRHLNSDLVVKFPAGDVYECHSGARLPAVMQIVVLHYLARANGKQLTGQWVNFRRLPGGLMYQQAFQAQVIEPIARTFGYDLAAFLEAGRRIGGDQARLGDGSFLFRVFPRVPVLLTLWLGDDELPPSADMLFDAAIPFYLSLEDIDAIGRELSARLIGARANP